MICATLVVGSTSAAREAVIAASINSKTTTAVLLEGFPDGTDYLERFKNIPTVHVVRIAPGCFCCTGNLTMTVTLNRLLRHCPARLYISLISNAHLARIQELLVLPPYDGLFSFTDVFDADKR